MSDDDDGHANVIAIARLRPAVMLTCTQTAMTIFNWVNETTIDWGETCVVIRCSAAALAANVHTWQAIGQAWLQTMPSNGISQGGLHVVKKVNVRKVKKRYLRRDSSDI